MRRKAPVSAICETAGWSSWDTAKKYCGVNPVNPDDKLKAVNEWGRTREGGNSAAANDEQDTAFHQLIERLMKTGMEEEEAKTLFADVLAAWLLRQFHKNDLSTLLTAMQRVLLKESKNS